MALDADYAETYLASQTEWEAEPELTQNERDSLLLTARAIDSAGRVPDASGYVATYSYESMNSAIYLAWIWKLAKAVELHEGDEKVIFDHCKQMVDYWSARASTVLHGDVTTSRPTFFTLASGTRGL